MTTRIRTMGRWVAGFAFFMAGIGALALMLKLVNWLPLALEEGAMRRYVSIEEAARRLDDMRLRVPSYIPQGLAWPPSAILAQSKPFEAVVIVLADTRTQRTSLVVSQSVERDFMPAWDMRMGSTEQEADHELHGRTARVAIGSCTDGSPCSRISWDEEGHRVSLLMRGPPFELIRIAESMIR